MKLFRLLRADEIECRVSRVTPKGVVLLLYKTARTDADLLDDTFGAGQWTNDFKIVDGVLYGGIGIKVDHRIKPDCPFVWKWDAGTESNTEAEKGRASDAFKRAGFKWGLGRELYSAPFIFIPAGKCNIENGKCYDNFKVGSISYDGEKISGLTITLKGATVFEWGGTLEEPAIPAAPVKKPNTDRVCADCGRDIMMSTTRNGEVWKSEDIKKYSERRYGRPLCVDCMKKADAEIKSAEEVNAADR